MEMPQFPVIDLSATGKNIVRLRKERGLSVKDLQAFFGFEEPQAIYKWQHGKSLPTVDNLYALGTLLNTPMEEILVSSAPKINIINNEQQTKVCCSNNFIIRLCRAWQILKNSDYFLYSDFLDFILGYQKSRI